MVDLACTTTLRVIRRFELHVGPPHVPHVGQRAARAPQRAACTSEWNSVFSVSSWNISSGIQIETSTKGLPCPILHNASGFGSCMLKSVVACAKRSKPTNDRSVRKPPTAPSQRKRAAARHRGKCHVQRAVQFHLTKPWTAARNLSMMCLSHVATRTHRRVFRTVHTLGTSNTKGDARSLRPKSSIHTHWGHGLQWFPSSCATGAAQSKKHRGRCARPPGCGERNRAHGKGCASSQAAYTSGPSR